MTNRPAVIGFLFSLSSFFAAFVLFYTLLPALILGIVGLIYSHRGRVLARNGAPHALLALAGYVLGIAGVVIGIVTFLAAAWIFTDGFKTA